jgi:hypothetical protein
MRILTYLLAAALLWAVASTGPSTSANGGAGRSGPAQGSTPRAPAHSR